MVPLIITEVLVFLLSLYVIIFQLVIPMQNGKKIFPMFRKSSLKKQVEATKEEVEDLKDQAASLTELRDLSKVRNDLEANIQKLNKGKTDVK